jgi:hypothetical protein
MTPPAGVWSSFVRGDPVEVDLDVGVERDVLIQVPYTWPRYMPYEKP